MGLLGITFVYGAVFGEQRPRGTFTRTSRAITGFLFGFAGAYLIWQSIRALGRLDSGLAIAIPILLIAVSCAAILQYRSWQEFKGWHSWPMAEATVEDADVREIRGRHNHYFVVDLTYSYVVSGEYYSGRFTRDFGDEPEAWDYANRVRGTKAVIHYHSHHPGRSKGAEFQFSMR
ncbi:MAG: DUF3592 domain-containing protein [Candidatus Korobacteraceae bacterium]